MSAAIVLHALPSCAASTATRRTITILALVAGTSAFAQRATQVPKAELERLQKANTEIAAGFARLDSTWAQIIELRSKIEFTLANREAMVLCIASQKISREILMLQQTRSRLNNEQASRLEEYRKLQRSLTDDLLKAEVDCNLAPPPRNKS